jgi:hypothetical protein
MHHYDLENKFCRVTIISVMYTSFNYSHRTCTLSNAFQKMRQCQGWYSGTSNNPDGKLGRFATYHVCAVASTACGGSHQGGLRVGYVTNTLQRQARRNDARRGMNPYSHDWMRENYADRLDCGRSLDRYNLEALSLSKHRHSLRHEALESHPGTKQLPSVLRGACADLATDCATW